MADSSRYPRNSEERARQLGAKLSCDAFNSLGSLDVPLCQRVGEQFAAELLEMLKEVKGG